MNVGIVTFHCSYNFGSALQAFALQEAIRSLGHHVRIIDYRSRDFNSYHIVRPLRPWTIPSSLSRLSLLLRRRAAFRAFWDKEFSLTDKRYSYLNEQKLNELQEDFDVFVCGSDQIWNLDCTNGVVGPFFLSFAGSKKRVSYAPSLAHMSFVDKNFDKRKVSNLLSQFDSLSVREEETVPLFQPLVNKRIDVVVDPTLLLDSEVYKEIAAERLIERPYIFIYLLRDCSELIETARNFADQGRVIVYVSDIDLGIANSINLFGVGPKEFLSLILHADLVLANSFHAVVFSILFHKQFGTFATDASASRMRNLLGMIGLGDCCLTDAISQFYQEIDWESVDMALSGLRDGSLKYLEKALAS